MPGKLDPDPGLRKRQPGGDRQQVHEEDPPPMEAMMTPSLDQGIRVFWCFTP
jgi:hypothetical protein